MILFISDLHLSPKRPDITQAFFWFMQTWAVQAEALYILGDFFDAWVGDDDDTPLFRDVETALVNFSQDKKLFFMHGNRDFMVGDAFSERTGAKLLDELHVIDIYGTPTLLMHGDSLCTLDKEYMQFRKLVRDPEWQQEVMKKSLAERKAIAAQMQATSQSMNSLKAEDIMDVTPEEVIKVMRDKQTPRLIHGHTHRPARHALSIPNMPNAERIVLGDWHHHGWFIKADNTDLSLERFPIET